MALLEAVLILCVAACSERDAAQGLINNLFKDYDPGRIPARPTEVSLSGTIAKVNQIRTSEQTVHLNMFMRHIWRDDRFVWNASDYCGVEMVKLSKSKTIWRPDTFFANSNEIKSPDGEEYTKIWSDGLVLWSKRMVLTIFCDMSFRKFPFDTQTCVSTLESYGYSTADLTYSLLSADNMNRSEIPAGFSMASTSNLAVGAYTMQLPSARVVEPAEYSGVSFSRVVLTYKFERNRSRYTVSMFIPLLLVVSISFVGLWIDPASVPARAMMSVTTQLVLISLMYILTRELPTTAYLTSLDYYFIICFLFLFFNTCEYALVNYLTTRCALLEADIAKRRAMRAKVNSETSGKELKVSCNENRRKKQMAELEEVFKLYDRHGTGSISTQDLGAVFLSFAEDRGRPLSLAEVRHWVELCDADKSGTIEFDELCHFAASHLQGFMNKEESRALLFMQRYPVTRMTVRLIEKRYRIISPCTFLVCTVSWLAFSLPRTPVESWLCVASAVASVVVSIGICIAILDPLDSYKKHKAMASLKEAYHRTPSFDQTLGAPMLSAPSDCVLSQRPCEMASVGGTDSL